ncbi:hypothetical protein ZWY2020_028644 [Hordeum vulgare]|nr:hypothetical protein ZWY2020_028644 [Hordeum vulgare]
MRLAAPCHGPTRPRHAARRTPRSATRLLPARPRTIVVASVVSKTDARKASRVGAPAPKVTEIDLVRRREEERLRLKRKAEAAKKRAVSTAREKDFGRRPYPFGVLLILPLEFLRTEYWSFVCTIDLISYKII